MNLDNFNQIAENYISKFDVMNFGPSYESFKWELFEDFAKFREEFDSEEGIAVEQFPEKLKLALKRAGTLINRSSTWPASGIVKMAEYEPETVMKLFSDLFADDGGDLENRIERIWYFVENANCLIDTYANGSWKYKQNMRDALAYLCLYSPSENYLYQYSYAELMARALEFPDAVNYGRYFSLRNYYEMCDAIKEQMLSHDGMKTVHSKIEKYTSKVNDKNNIWVYDFIYCAKTYALYTDVEFVNFDKKSVAKREKELAKQAKLTELLNTISVCEDKLNEYQEKLDSLAEVNIDGRSIAHKTFGNGFVKQTGTKLTIEFARGTKIFKLPDSIAQGFISLDDGNITNICKEQYSVKTEMTKLQKQIGFAESEINRL